MGRTRGWRESDLGTKLGRARGRRLQVAQRRIGPGRKWRPGWSGRDSDRDRPWCERTLITFLGGPENRRRISRHFPAIIRKISRYSPPGALRGRLGRHSSTRLSAISTAIDRRNRPERGRESPGTRDIRKSSRFLSKNTIPISGYSRAHGCGRSSPPVSPSRPSGERVALPPEATSRPIEHLEGVAHP